MTAVDASPGFSIGRVISRLFAVLGRNLVTFLLLSVLLVGLPTAVVSFIQLSAMGPLMGITPGGADPSAALSRIFSPLGVSLGAAAYLVSLASNSVLQGAVIHGSVSDLSGQRASFSECLATGFRFFLPLVAIGVLVAIGCFFGFLIFLVPGVILALAWCVAAPAEVVERAGVIGALGRSWQLTQNHRGAILGLAVIMFIAQFIVQTVLSSFLGIGLGVGGAMRGMQGFVVAQSVLGVIERTLIASVTSAGVASVYFELRQIKEGIGAEQLAAVFD